MISVLALDVNETLSDMRALGARLEALGAPGELLQTWFASTLRDGFALTAAGAYADFATVAHAALRPLLAEVQSLRAEPHEAATQLVSGIAELPLHEDVRPALERLNATPVRVVTITNGSAANTRKLLEGGGVSGYVEQCLSVEEVRRWKPAREAYRLVAERCGVPLEEVMLAAVHPWDVDGAKRAGLAGAWINRADASYPQHLSRPDMTPQDFVALADALAVAAAT